jgi:hypothetical protein
MIIVLRIGAGMIGVRESRMIGGWTIEIAPGGTLGGVTWTARTAGGRREIIGAVPVPERLDGGMLSQTVASHVTMAATGTPLWIATGRGIVMELATTAIAGLRLLTAETFEITRCEMKRVT